MDWSEFKKNIDAGKIAKVYTFAGRERYLMEMALTALKAAVLSDGFEALNDTVLEAPSARQIIDAAETFPIMCDRRMLTVIDWRPATDGGAESDKDETALLETWIRNPPETCITVFYMKRELDGRRKAAMLLKQNSVFVQFDTPQPVQMFALMDARLAEYKKTITGEAREHLAVMMNHDMTAIMTELDKLISYIGERKAIEKKDIDAITTPSLEYSIFRITDDLLHHDLGSAQRIVNSLLQNGETCFSLLAVLTYQYRNLAHIRLALDAGISLDRVQEELKISYKAARQSEMTVRRIPSARLEKGYQDCLKTAAAIRTGRSNERSSFDMLLIRLARL